MSSADLSGYLDLLEAATSAKDRERAVCNIQSQLENGQGIRDELHVGSAVYLYRICGMDVQDRECVGLIEQHSVPYESKAASRRAKVSSTAVSTDSPLALEALAIMRDGNILSNSQCVRACRPTLIERLATALERSSMDGATLAGRAVDLESAAGASRARLGVPYNVRVRSAQSLAELCGTAGGMLVRSAKPKGGGVDGGGGGGGATGDLAVDKRLPLLNIGDTIENFIGFLQPLSLRYGRRTHEKSDAASGAATGYRSGEVQLDEEDIAVGGHLLRGLSDAVEARGYAALTPMLEVGTGLAHLVADLWPRLDSTQTSYAFFREQAARFILCRLQLSRTASHVGRPPLISSSYRALVPVPVEYQECHRRLEEQIKAIEAGRAGGATGGSAAGAPASGRGKSRASEGGGGAATGANAVGVRWKSDGLPLRSFSSPAFQRDLEEHLVRVPDPDAAAMRVMRAVAPGYWQRKRLRAAQLLCGRSLVPGDPLGKAGETEGSSGLLPPRKLLRLDSMPSLDEPGAGQNYMLHPLAGWELAAGPEAVLAGSRAGAPYGGDQIGSLETGGPDKMRDCIADGTALHPGEVALFHRHGSDTAIGVSPTTEEVRRDRQRGTSASYPSSWLAAAAAAVVSCPVSPRMHAIVRMTREGIRDTASKADDGHSLVKELWKADGIAISQPEGTSYSALLSASHGGVVSGAAARGTWDASEVLARWVPSDEFVRELASERVEELGGKGATTDSQPEVEAERARGQILPKLEEADAARRGEGSPPDYDWRGRCITDLTILETTVRLHPDSPLARTAELRVAMLRLCLTVLEGAASAGVARTWNRRQRVVLALELLLGLAAAPWKVPAAVDTPASIASRGAPHPIGEEPRIAPSDASYWSQHPIDVEGGPEGTPVAAASGAGASGPGRDGATGVSGRPEAAPFSSDASISWWLSPPLYESAASFNSSIAADMLRRFETSLVSKAPMGWLHRRRREDDADADADEETEDERQWNRYAWEQAMAVGASSEAGFEVPPRGSDDHPDGVVGKGRVSPWQVGEPHLTISTPLEAAATRTLQGLLGAATVRFVRAQYCKAILLQIEAELWERIFDVGSRSLFPQSVRAAMSSANRSLYSAGALPSVATDGSEDVLLSMSAISSTWLLLTAAASSMPATLCPAMASLTGRCSLAVGRSVGKAIPSPNFLASIGRTTQVLKQAQANGNSGYSRPFGPYYFFSKESVPPRTMNRWLHHALPDGAASHRTCGQGPLHCVARDVFGTGSSTAGGAGSCFVQAISGIACLSDGSSTEGAPAGLGMSYLAPAEEVMVQRADASLRVAVLRMNAMRERAGLSSDALRVFEPWMVPTSSGAAGPRVAAALQQVTACDSQMLLQLLAMELRGAACHDHNFSSSGANASNASADCEPLPQLAAVLSMLASSKVGQKATASLASWITAPIAQHEAMLYLERGERIQTDIGLVSAEAYKAALAFFSTDNRLLPAMSCPQPRDTPVALGRLLGSALPSGHLAAFSLLLEDSQPICLPATEEEESKFGPRVGIAAIGSIVAAWAEQVVKDSIGSASGWSASTDAEAGESHVQMDQTDAPTVVVTAAVSEPCREASMVAGTLLQLSAVVGRALGCMPSPIDAGAVSCLEAVSARLVILWPAVVLGAAAIGCTESEQSAAASCLAKTAAICRALSLGIHHEEERDGCLGPRLAAVAKVMQDLGTCAALRVIAEMQAGLPGGGNSAASGAGEAKKAAAPLPVRIRKCIRYGYQQLKLASPALEAWAASRDPCGSQVVEDLRRELGIAHSSKLSDPASLAWAVGRPQSRAGSGQAAIGGRSGLLRRGVSMAVRRRPSHKGKKSSGGGGAAMADQSEDDRSDEEEEEEEDDDAFGAGGVVAASGGGRRGISVMRRMAYESGRSSSGESSSATPIATSGLGQSVSFGATAQSLAPTDDGDDMFAMGIEGISAASSSAQGGKKRYRGVAFAPPSASSGGRPPKRSRRAGQSGGGQSGGSSESELSERSNGSLAAAVLGLGSLLGSSAIQLDAHPGSDQRASDMQYSASLCNAVALVGSRVFHSNLGRSDCLGAAVVSSLGLAASNALFSAAVNASAIAAKATSDTRAGETQSVASEWMVVSGRCLQDLCRKVIDSPASVGLPASGTAASSVALGCSLSFDAVYPVAYEIMAGAQSDPVKYVIEDVHKKDYSLARTLFTRVKLSAATLHQYVAYLSRSPSAHVMHASLIGAAAMEATGNAWDDAIKVIYLTGGTVPHVADFLQDESFGSLFASPLVSSVALSGLARMTPYLNAIMEVGWSLPTPEECAKFGVPAIREHGSLSRSKVALRRVGVSEAGHLIPDGSSSVAFTKVTMPSSAGTGVPLLPRPGTEVLGEDTDLSFHSHSYDSRWSNAMDRSLEYVDVASLMHAEGQLKAPKATDSVVNPGVSERLVVTDGLHSCALGVRVGALAAMATQGIGSARLRGHKELFRLAAVDCHSGAIARSWTALAAPPVVPFQVVATSSPVLEQPGVLVPSGFDSVLVPLLIDPYRPTTSVLNILWGHHATLRLNGAMRDYAFTAATCSSAVRAVVESYTGGGRGSRASPATQDALLEKGWTDSLVVSSKFPHRRLALYSPSPLRGSVDKGWNCNAPLKRISRIMDVLREAESDDRDSVATLEETLAAMQDITVGSATAVPASAGAVRSMWGDSQVLQPFAELLGAGMLTAGSANDVSSSKYEADRIVKPTAVRHVAVVMAAVGGLPGARLLRRAVLEDMGLLLVRAGVSYPDSIGSAVPWRRLPSLPSFKLQRAKVMRDVASIIGRGDLANALGLGQQEAVLFSRGAHHTPFGSSSFDCCDGLASLGPQRRRAPTDGSVPADSTEVLVRTLMQQDPTNGTMGVSCNATLASQQVEADSETLSARAHEAAYSGRRLPHSSALRHALSSPSMAFDLVVSHAAKLAYHPLQFESALNRSVRIISLATTSVAHAQYSASPLASLVVAMSATRRVVESLGISSLLLTKYLEVCELVRRAGTLDPKAGTDRPSKSLRRSSSTGISSTSEERFSVASLLASYVALERAAPSLIASVIEAVSEAAARFNCCPTGRTPGGEPKEDPFINGCIRPAIILLEQILRALADAGALLAAAGKQVRMRDAAHADQAAVQGGEVLVHMIQLLSGIKENNLEPQVRNSGLGQVHRTLASCRCRDLCARISELSAKAAYWYLRPKRLEPWEPEPEAADGMPEEVNLTQAARAVRNRAGTDAPSLFLRDPEVQISRSEIRAFCDRLHQGTFPARVQAPMSGAGEDSATDSWIDESTQQKVQEEWTLCRSLPSHIVSRSLMAFGCACERASFAALRLEVADSQWGPNGGSQNDPEENIGAVNLLRLQSNALACSLRSILESDDVGSAVSIVVHGDPSSAYDCIRRVVHQNDIVADATSDVKSNVAAVQRGCASLARILGAAEKWERSLGGQGNAAVAAAVQAMGLLVGALGARVLPQWLHTAIESSLNGPSGDLHNSDLGGNVALLQASSISKAYGRASQRSLEIQIGDSSSDASSDEEEEEEEEDEEEDIDSPTLVRSGGRYSGMRGKHSSSRRRGTIFGVGIHRVLHAAKDNGGSLARKSDPQHSFNVLGTLAAAYDVAKTRTEVLTGGMQSSELASWGLYDVASRTSSFAAFGQVAGMLSCGALAGGTVSQSDGPSGYTCRPSLQTPLVQAGWSVKYYESTSTQSAISVGMTYAFAPAVSRLDYNLVRAGLLDFVSVPVKSTSREATLQTTEQPTILRRMSTSDAKAAAGSASIGQWPSAPRSFVVAELQSRLDLSLPFRELSGMQAFVAAKSGIITLCRYQQVRTVTLQTSCRRFRSSMAATDIELHNFDRKYDSLSLPPCGTARAGAIKQVDNSASTLGTAMLQPGVTSAAILDAGAGLYQPRRATRLFLSHCAEPTLRFMATVPLVGRLSSRNGALLSMAPASAFAVADIAIVSSQHDTPMARTVCGSDAATAVYVPPIIAGIACTSPCLQVLSVLGGWPTKPLDVDSIESVLYWIARLLPVRLRPQCLDHTDSFMSMDAAKSVLEISKYSDWLPEHDERGVFAYPPDDPSSLPSDVRDTVKQARDMLVFDGGSLFGSHSWGCFLRAYGLQMLFWTLRCLCIAKDECGTAPFTLSIGSSHVVPLRSPCNNAISSSSRRGWMNEPMSFVNGMNSDTVKDVAVDKPQWRGKGRPPLLDGVELQPAVRPSLDTATAIRGPLHPISILTSASSDYLVHQAFVDAINGTMESLTSVQQAAEMLRFSQRCAMYLHDDSYSGLQRSTAHRLHLDLVDGLATTKTSEHPSSELQQFEDAVASIAAHDITSIGPLQMYQQALNSSSATHSDPMVSVLGSVLPAWLKYSPKGRARQKKPAPVALVHRVALQCLDGTAAARAVLSANSNGRNKSWIHYMRSASIRGGETVQLESLHAASAGTSVDAHVSRGAAVGDVYELAAATELDAVSSTSSSSYASRGLHSIGIATEMQQNRAYAALGTWAVSSNAMGRGPSAALPDLPAAQWSASLSKSLESYTIPAVFHALTTKQAAPRLLALDVLQQSCAAARFPMAGIIATSGGASDALGRSTSILGETRGLQWWDRSGSRSGGGSEFAISQMLGLSTTRSGNTIGNLSSLELLRRKRSVLLGFSPDYRANALVLQSYAATAQAVLASGSLQAPAPRLSVARLVRESAMAFTACSTASIEVKEGQVGASLSGFAAELGLTVGDAATVATSTASDRVNLAEGVQQLMKVRRLEADSSMSGVAEGYYGYGSARMEAGMYSAATEADVLRRMAMNASQRSVEGEYTGMPTIFRHCRSQAYRVAQSGWWRGMQAVANLHAAQFADACRARIESVFASQSFRGQHDLYRKYREVYENLLAHNLYTLKELFDYANTYRKSIYQQLDRQPGSRKSLEDYLKIVNAEYDEHRINLVNKLKVAFPDIKYLEVYYNMPNLKTMLYQFASRSDGLLRQHRASVEMAVQGFGQFLQLQTPSLLPLRAKVARSSDEDGEMPPNGQGATQDIAQPDSEHTATTLPLLSAEHIRALHGAPIAAVELASAFRLLQMVFDFGGYSEVAAAAADVLHRLPVRIMLPASNQLAVRLFADAAPEVHLPLYPEELKEMDVARLSFIKRVVPAVLSKMLVRRTYGTLPSVLQHAHGCSGIADRDITADMRTAENRSRYIIEGAGRGASSVTRAIAVAQLGWKASIAIALRDQKKIGSYVSELDLSKEEILCQIDGADFKNAIDPMGTGEDSRGRSGRKSTRSSAGLAAGGAQSIYVLMEELRARDLLQLMPVFTATSELDADSVNSVALSSFLSAIDSHTSGRRHSEDLDVSIEAAGAGTDSWPYDGTVACAVAYAQSFDGHLDPSSGDASSTGAAGSSHGSIEVRPRLGLIYMISKIRIERTGVSRPRTVSLLAADGVKHRAVHKGPSEDMRYDQMVTHLLRVFNVLLAANPQARCRGLRMREHRILPLSRKTGMLQYVPSLAGHNELIHSGSSYAGVPALQQLIRPHEPSISTIRKFYGEQRALGKYRSAGEGLVVSGGGSRPTTVEGTPLLTELELLLVTFAMHRPVLQHFASIRFPGARELRLARGMYARSAATSSALGHVTGLGDRHGGNVRVDVNRHEVVHIDFGVCFEQGKLLSSPEWVPFRLTRELVACMGAAGIEGTFRSSMELSLACLRKRRSMVLSLLRTFLADPLAKWQSVLQKLAHKTGGGGGLEDGAPEGASPDEEATPGGGLMQHNETVRYTVEGAISRVSEKLYGQDVVPGMAVPVSEQVNALIRYAQDPRRLCTMFEGWQMWC